MSENKHNFEDIRLAESDRAILAAALPLLYNKIDERDGDPLLLAHISSLQEIFREKSKMAVLATAPEHIEVDEGEFLSVLTAFDDAENWMLRLTRQSDWLDVGETYKLVAEVFIDDDRFEYEIAKNLKAAGGFLELRDEDRAFFNRIDQTLIDFAPRSVQKFHRNILEVPVPWELLAQKADSDTLYNHMSDITDEAGVIIQFLPRASHVHVYSDKSLAAYAAVRCEVWGPEDDLRVLQETIESFKAGIVEQEPTHGM